MTEKQAEYLVEILGGEVWRSPWGACLVAIERQDNHLVIINDESISEYKNKTAFLSGIPRQLFGLSKAMILK